MTIPNISIPALATNVDADIPGALTPPTDSSSSWSGFDAGNMILGGDGNVIENSRRCTIINGASNYLIGKYNTHIIGDAVTKHSPYGWANTISMIDSNSNCLDNAFYVGCYNGIFSAGDVVAFASSDKRLKDNISILIDPLEKVLRLDAVEFDWNDKQETYTGHDIGLIAQQVEEVAPELVTTRPTGYKAVKYEKLTALLVGAIKEQQKQIEFLEKRVESLERRSKR